MLFRRSPILVALALLLAAALPSSAAAANSQAETPLQAVQGSGVQGTVTVTAKRHGPSLLALDVQGLPPGAKYTARLHGGTCALPSASAGVLGSLVPGDDGQARLLSQQVQFSAAGAAMPLSLDLLADGGHVVMLVDAASGPPLACAAIPAFARSGADDMLPGTGVDSVDAIVQAALDGDAAALGARLQVTDAPCGPPLDGGREPQPICQPDEPSGAIVQAIPVAGCESGGWARDPQAVLDGFAQEAWRLHAVGRGSVVSPPGPALPHADYVIVFDPRPGSALTGLAAYVRDDALVAIEAGCRTPEDLMRAMNGDPLEIVPLRAAARTEPLFARPDPATGR